MQRITYIIMKAYEGLVMGRARGSNNGDNGRTQVTLNNLVIVTVTP